MNVDGKVYEIGDIIIEDSNYIVNGKKKKANFIDIVSKGSKVCFGFWTLVPLEDFNNFSLNERVDIIDKIDNYDINLSIDDNHYVFSEENSEVYITKIKDNVFNLSVIINDGSKAIISNTDEYFDNFMLDVTITKK